MTSLLQAGSFLMMLPAQPLGDVSSSEFSVMLMDSLVSSTQLLLSVTCLIFIKKKKVSCMRTATVMKVCF